MPNQGVYHPSFESSDTPFLTIEQKLVRQKVIVVHSTKGGVGKTTIAKNLAHACVYYGKKVVVIDANTDGNLAEVMNTSYNYTLDHWNQFGDDLDIQTVTGLLSKDKYGTYILPSGSHPSIFPQTIAKAIKHLSMAFEIIIVDTETKLTPAMIQCLDVADNVLIVGNDNPNIYPRLSVRIMQLISDPYGMQGLGYERSKVNILINQKESINVKQAENMLQFKVSSIFDYEDKVEKNENQRESTFFTLPKTKFAKSMKGFAKELLADVGYTEQKKKGWFSK